ncbi:Hpt domain-containing protein [Roseateles sp. P5_E7]
MPSGVSFETGLRRCLGRLALYDRIARRFLETRAGDARKLQAAVDLGDLDSVRKLSHDIASTAGTLGADGLSATALALQAAADAGAHAASLARLAQRFTAQHAEVLAALAAYARGDVDLKAIAPRKS